MVDIDYDHPRVFDFRTARVVGHSKTKREAFDQARSWWSHYKLIGRYFTGRLPVRPLLRPPSSSMTRLATPFVTAGDLIVVEALVTARAERSSVDSCSILEQLLRP